MTRQDVYDLCSEKICQKSPNYRHIDGCGYVRVEDEDVWVSKLLLPESAIDAIIDCAVEEAIALMKVKESKH